MKTFILFFLYSLITEGVFGESVKEGDSVTLHTGLSEIQTNDVIDWWFGGHRIARMKKGREPSITDYVLDGKFKGRLKLDGQTGDLTITNFRNTDSGDYKVSNSINTLNVLFTLIVVSVLEGDSVTLQTGLTEIQTDKVIQWRYGQQKSLVAEINRTSRFFETPDGPDERFRDRLQLDHQTGSLNITNINTTDSGLYEVKISSKQTIHHKKLFSVTVRDSVKTVSVLEGDNVTLHTGLTEKQTDDKIVWKFGDDEELFPRLNRPVNNRWIYAYLNDQTGDLTISNIQRDQNGHYKVEIITRTIILYRKYQITIDAVKSVSVMEGESVTLPITEIQNDDLIWWMFGNIRLAEIDKADQRFYISDVLEKSFRDRLKLDHQTGSLTIMNTRTTDSGLYEVKISNRSRYTINRRFTVTVTETYINTAYTPRGTASSSNNYPAVPDPGLSPAAAAGIGGGVGGGVVLAAAAAGVFYYRYKRSKNSKDNQMQNQPLKRQLAMDNMDMDSKDNQMQNQPLKGQLADDTENVSLKNLCGSQSAESDTENSPFREIKGNKEHGYEIL